LDPPSFEFRLLRHGQPFLSDDLGPDIQFVDPNALELVNEPRRRVKLPPRRFGMTMEITSKFNESVVVRDGLFHVIDEAAARQEALDR
jgi:hypothetical protein